MVAGLRLSQRQENRSLDEKSAYLNLSGSSEGGFEGGSSLLSGPGGGRTRRGLWKAQAPCCPTPASSGVGSGAGPSLGSGEINHRGAPCQGGIWN